MTATVNPDPINEGTSARVSVEWTDFDGAPATPTSVTYRIDCLTTGQAVRASTPATPAATTVIDLTSDDNAIRDQANASERRIVTVVATYGSAADRCTLQYVYTVTNLQYVA
jgi:hypothetical protein